jgi:hypothetical protein
MPYAPEGATGIQEEEEEESCISTLLFASSCPVVYHDYDTLAVNTTNFSK